MRRAGVSSFCFVSQNNDVLSVKTCVGNCERSRIHFNTLAFNLGLDSVLTSSNYALTAFPTCSALLPFRREASRFMSFNLPEHS